MTSSDELPPQTVHQLREYTPPPGPERFYENYAEDVPIALDLGTSSYRVGLTNADDPNNVFPPLISKYRDRKLQKSLTIIGNDVLTDYQTLRSSSKTPYDGPLITNWEQFENIIDYSFEYLGVKSTNGNVPNPVILTEPVCCPFAQRKQMYETMFEVYQVPKLALGIDHLFSYYENSSGRSTGLVIGMGNEATHLIPVVAGKGILSQTKRIDFGGNTASNFLGKLLALKYPYFPQKLTSNHTMELFKDWCYVSPDYQNELKTFLDMPELEKKDIVIQYPVDVSQFQERKKSDEFLAKQAERRREQGRRLQEQTRIKRQEKLEQKQQELDYYTKLKEDNAHLTEEEFLAVVQENEFESISEFRKYVANLEKTLKKSNNGEEDEDEPVDPATAWPLVDIPDDQLTPDQVKDKRKQRLAKGNWEAREKLKQAKLEEQAKKEQYEREQREWRERDLEDYTTTKRLQLAELIKKHKEVSKILESMKDRKSAAAQLRMRNLTELAQNASGQTAASRKRRKNANVTVDNDPNDTFGANDDDWAVYRDVTNASLEEEQAQLNNDIVAIEADLLEHDPSFTKADTFAASLSFDWKESVLHKFIHGPRPNVMFKLQAEGLPEDEIASHPDMVTKNHQMHLNIERIRVPEILFQPHMAGLDQAGVTEVASDLFHRRLDGNFSPGGESYAMIQDVFLTGGLCHLPNITDRVQSELTAVLPQGAPLHVRQARNCDLDPWRGMRKWANSEDSKNGYITRKEYDELGPEYIKEHNLGNVMMR
ncbi:hypothetical protein DIURU_000742 [Diutina rugosa]|uniref:Actin-related protein 5 n=1 Tax=Diutina rugosa TaxID=5481 RepID=A0A642UWN4_DIURU|nr:uncharacterized protein DIURU_000742 [Diutina rugosa]KAA8907058.1 hypothetical protein DIURU_000742 [Diutina rugosa]